MTLTMRALCRRWALNCGEQAANAAKSLRRRLEVRFSCRKALKRFASKGQEVAGPRYRRGFGGEYDAVSHCDRSETLRPIVTRYPGFCAAACLLILLPPAKLALGG